MNARDLLQYDTVCDGERALLRRTWRNFKA
jgi:hypothetical protein